MFAKSFAVLAALALPLAAADFRAGVSRMKITPDTPIRLSGYAARTHASEGAAMDLWAKALAIEDSRGGRAVIVTTDLIGLPHAISDVVAAECLKQYGLERERLVLNSSHTHTGPVLRPNLSVLYALSAEENRRVEEYRRKLTSDLVTVIGAALGDLKPARLEYGEGSASFAINRRDPSGPRDPSVPVLKVTGEDGSLRAVLFGYACHNTTLTADSYLLSGDYAGYAQTELERRHPGAAAMFAMLCGADQNPNPRGTADWAARHGQALAAEVSQILESRLRPVRGQIRAAFQMTDLPLAPHTRESFEKELSDSDVFKARRAKLVLDAYEERRPLSKIACPVQAVRIGKDLTLVALGGEPVVDYALRLKRELGSGEPLIVLGYSNDVMCYIPSLRVLKEGGYEAVGSMVYYGQPGPFADEVEDTVMAAVRNVLRRTGRQESGQRPKAR